MPDGGGRSDEEVGGQGTTVKRAPRLLSFFVPALEKVVMDRRADDVTRIAAWLKLFKVCVAQIR